MCRCTLDAPGREPWLVTRGEQSPRTRQETRCTCTRCTRATACTDVGAATWEPRSEYAVCACDNATVQPHRRIHGAHVARRRVVLVSVCECVSRHTAVSMCVCKRVRVRTMRCVVSSSRSQQQEKSSPAAAESPAREVLTNSRSLATGRDSYQQQESPDALRPLQQPGSRSSASRSFALQWAAGSFGMACGPLGSAGEWRGAGSSRSQRGVTCRPRCMPPDRCPVPVISIVGS